MSEILCSTGALLGRGNNRDYRLLPALARELRCDGFELMLYAAWYPEIDTLIRTLQSFRLHIPVLHCEKSIGEHISVGQSDEALRLFEVNCRAAQALGADRLVLHLWGGFPSDQHFERNMAAYPRLDDLAEAHGLSLLIENVVSNQCDPLTRLTELAHAYPDIRFVYDTKMAAFHQQNERLYDPDCAWLARHIRHCHVNDYAGGYMDWANLCTLPIGQGHVDFERFFRHLQHTGYTGDFTVESSACDQHGHIDTAMLNRQFKLIRNAFSTV